MASPYTTSCERCGEYGWHTHSTVPGRETLNLKLHFNYELQVWVDNGIVLGCGHLASFVNQPCCNARLYAGYSEVRAIALHGAR